MCSISEARPYFGAGAACCGAGACARGDQSFQYPHLSALWVLFESGIRQRTAAGTYASGKRSY
jgi:hypothetical protein